MGVTQNNSSKKNTSSVKKTSTTQKSSAKKSSSERIRSTDVDLEKMRPSSQKKKPSGKLSEKLKKIAKIDRLPKTAADTIPFRGIMDNGIIETYPGTFTKTYKLDDVNFSIAPLDEQMSMFRSFMDFLNSFNDSTKWQFNIFNHEIDKKKTLENIKITSQRDGLNEYRNEMNHIMLDNLKQGNNSIQQDKYLTVAVDEPSADHAVTVLRRLDAEVSKKIRAISKRKTLPMTAMERMKLLYDIYNMDPDYRMSTGIYDGNEEFSLAHIEKLGLSIKDVIGVPIEFNKDHFYTGEMYGQAMYLERVPSSLSTNFLSDLADIQSNMLISITSESISGEDAVKMVKNQLGTIESKVSSVQKKHTEDGYFGELPPELERSQKNARELMNDITGRNQSLFFLTVTIVTFARTKELLDETLKLIKSVSGKHQCPIKIMRYQQEFAFNTALPLCRNDIFADILYTTESAAVFIPYSSQEINQKNAIFYGLNQQTKSMVLYDRLSGDNFNGLIFGAAGSGKSVIAKCEMVSVMLKYPEAQIFVIDPQGEYAPFIGPFKGQEIILSPNSPKSYINPLDLDISTDEENEVDPIAMKIDFIVSIFKIIRKGQEFDPIYNTILDRAARHIYAPYLEYLAAAGITCDRSKCPTLADLYQELEMQKAERYEAGVLADIIGSYAVGSFTTFAHRTNINTDSRFVVYNTRSLGSGMKDLGLYVCTNDIWNRMIENSKKDVYTWFYIDEFHVLLESPDTTVTLKQVFKMARKWLGVPTGIMQNTEDILASKDARAIINNTYFVIMLKEPLMDRQNLAELFNLSNAQLEYITDSEKGHGLLYNGKVTIPFGYDFPKKTKLYKMMTTSHDAA